MNIASFWYELRKPLSFSSWDVFDSANPKNPGLKKKVDSFSFSLLERIGRKESTIALGKGVCLKERQLVALGYPAI